MLGTIVNCLAIIAGGLFGILLKNRIPERYNRTLLQAMGLSVILVGIKSTLGCDNLLIIILSLAIGSILGEIAGIEDFLERTGNFLETKFSDKNKSIAAGFSTASLLYCIGPMAIVGALESGLAGSHDTLFAKAILDGVVSILLGSSLGIGVLFSSFSVLLYQGFIVLTADLLKPMLTQTVISQMSAAGGLLIIAIGLNMIREKKIRVGNMLPAVFVPLLYFVIKTLSGI